MNLPKLHQRAASGVGIKAVPAGSAAPGLSFDEHMEQSRLAQRHADRSADRNGEPNPALEGVCATQAQFENTHGDREVQRQPQRIPPRATQGICIGLAAMNLVIDFDMIEQGIRRGADEKFAWYASFGILVTLIWLYIEILRLLGYMRSN